MKIFKMENENTALKGLQKKLAEIERKHKNIMEAITDCDDRELRQSFFAEAKKIEEERENIEVEIAREQKSRPTEMSESHIKFFLAGLKKGDINDIKYRKVLISVFVNEIYLYDDRLTMIFNSGDEPVTISDKLLSEIEVSNGADKILFLDKSAPLKNSRKCYITFYESFLFLFFK